MKLKKVALFTNEYAPYIYGGAGVHVKYLSKALAEPVPVDVRCLGNQDYSDGNLTVRGYAPWEEMRRNTDKRFAGPLGAFSRSLAMAKDTLDADGMRDTVVASRIGGIPEVVVPEEHFSCRAIAQKTLELYEALADRRKGVE